MAETRERLYLDSTCSTVTGQNGTGGNERKDFLSDLF